MWVKMPMIFQSEVKERALDPPTILAHTIYLGVFWNNQALGIQKLQVTYGVGEGEFHPGIYPKAAALCKTHRPAGGGGTLAYSKSQRKPTCKPLQTRPHLGGQPTSSVLLHRRQPSGKPEAKTRIYKRRAAQKSHLEVLPWGRLPSSFLWFHHGKEGKSRDSPGTA